MEENGRRGRTDIDPRAEVATNNFKDGRQKTCLAERGFGAYLPVPRGGAFFTFAYAPTLSLPPLCLVPCLI